MLPKKVILNNGIKMPAIGFGTWTLKGQEGCATIREAINVGYRLIDTAARYENEDSVGQAIKQVAIAREELFITSKLRGSEHGYDKTIKAFHETLNRLQLDYLDLYLIHWPLPSKNLYVQTWKALITLYNEGLIKAIGVSNFKINHLSRIIDETAVVPAVNQIQLNPFFPQEQIRHWCHQYNITCQAWSPLGRNPQLLATPILVELTEKHQKSPAQIILRWHLQQGIPSIPKSTHTKRMKENLDIFDFELSNKDMQLLSTLDKHLLPDLDPDTHIEE